MILVYPFPYAGDPPNYLITGDMVLFMQDAQTVHNMQRVGIPQVAYTIDDINLVLEKLDPSVEHPLAIFAPDPVPDNTIDGGDPDDLFFSGYYDGGAANQAAFLDSPLNGGLA